MRQMVPEDPRNARTVQPSPCRIFSASGPANQWTPLSSRPCLPLCRRRCKWQGPLAPRTLLRFIATTDPSATLSSSADFPGSPVIRPTLLRRFRAGARRASPVAWHVLVTVLSLSPRRDQDAASVRFRHPMLPSPFVCGLGSRVHLFSRPLRVHSHYGPVTRDLPKGDLVDGLQSLGFPPPCHPSYGASDFCPG